MIDVTWTSWFVAGLIVVTLPMLSSDPAVVLPVFGLCTVSFYLGVTTDV